MGCYLAITEKETLPSVTRWVDLEGSLVSTIGQTETGKCHMITLTCGIKTEAQVCCVGHSYSIVTTETTMIKTRIFTMF